MGAFRRWKSWASNQSFKVLPAPEQHVALYLQHVAETSSSRAVVEEAVYALAWAHDLAIIKSKKGECLKAKGSLGYSTLWELFKKKMRDLGYSTENLGIHSLRAGSATAAANAGVSDRLFKRHGQWKSENAKDGYVEDTLEKRLSVSCQIGL